MLILQMRKLRFRDIMQFACDSHPPKLVSKSQLSVVGWMRTFGNSWGLVFYLGSYAFRQSLRCLGCSLKIKARLKTRAAPCIFKSWVYSSQVAAKVDTLRSSAEGRSHRMSSLPSCFRLTRVASPAYILVGPFRLSPAFITLVISHVALEGTWICQELKSGI